MTRHTEALIQIAARQFARETVIVGSVVQTLINNSLFWDEDPGAVFPDQRPILRDVAHLTAALIADGSSLEADAAVARFEATRAEDGLTSVIAGLIRVFEICNQEPNDEILKIGRFWCDLDRNKSTILFPDIESPLSKINNEEVTYSYCSRNRTDPALKRTFEADFTFFAPLAAWHDRAEAEHAARLDAIDKLVRPSGDV